MQIAPTIRLIDTRFDILFSPILKNRSQGMLDRFARFSAPPLPWRPLCRTRSKPAASGRVQRCKADPQSDPSARRTVTTALVSGRQSHVAPRANGSFADLLVFDRNSRVRERRLNFLHSRRHGLPFAVFNGVLAVRQTFAAGRRDTVKRGISTLPEARAAEWLTVMTMSRGRRSASRRFIPIDATTRRGSPSRRRPSYACRGRGSGR
jgi:hypothetical protein